MLRLGVGLLASVFACACSSGYEPAKSPHITIADDGATFMKDGTRYGSTVFGIGLVDAVRGNPRAEKQARIGRNLAVAGFVLGISGLSSEAAGWIVLQHDRDRTGHSTLALGLGLGGMVALVAGGVMLVTAPSHLDEAVTIYNDGVDASPH